MKVCAVLFMIFGFVFGDFGRGEPWVVNINQGPIRGYKEPGHNYFAFYGIPYATAPGGRHKFKAPLAAPNWTETLEATNRYIMCPQSNLIFSLLKDKHYFMTENCLYANIYIPDNKPSSLPVVVYVHGGGFQAGFGEAMSQIPLVQTKKVIVVNINYRLGIHGFLCLGTEDVPGNAGMKDQVAALRWVRDNIAKFGGNPKDVTIAGCSAGSASVEFLMLSKTARGLFTKVIPESGSAAAGWAVQTDPIGLAKQFALLHNFTNIHDLDALEQFYKTTALDVFDYNSFMFVKNSTFSFVPCIESSTVTEESFLVDKPINILGKGDFESYPILLGFAEMEGMLRLPVFDTWSVEMNINFEDFLPADLAFETKELKLNVAKEVKEFYFGDKEINLKTIRNYVDYFTDIMMAYPILRSFRLYKEAGLESIYLYEFSYIDETISTIHNFSGAFHCAQSANLVSDNVFTNRVAPITEEYKKVQKMMVELWANFISYGKPVLEKSSMFPEGWPEATKEETEYMELTLVPKLRKHLEKNRIDFWDRIYETYYKQTITPRRIEL